MNALVGKVVNGNSIQLSGTIVPQISLAGHISLNIVLQGSAVIPETLGDNYVGKYVFTPTRERQVIPTQLKTLQEDLVINPIPEQYGFVTYNQSRELIIT